MSLAVAFDSVHLMQTMGHAQLALGPIRLKEFEH